MRARAGFTLFELLVAIVLAGVVALLVYGVADAGRETQGRLLAQRRALQTARGFRTVLEDALRNARAGVDTAFRLEVRRDPQGRPADRLWFVTAGGLPPLTDDADWEVTVEPTPDGMVLVALPVGVAQPVPVMLRSPGHTGLEVRVLGLEPTPAWTDRWTFPSLLPRAVQLTYWNGAGPVDAALRLAFPLGGVQ